MSTCTSVTRQGYDPELYHILTAKNEDPTVSVITDVLVLTKSFCCSTDHWLLPLGDVCMHWNSPGWHTVSEQHGTSPAACHRLHQPQVH